MSGTPMRFRPLGRTGLNVSVASLGSGGDSRLGQSTHGSREDSHHVIRHALDLGINLIDTAPVYMDSERILGEALHEVPRDSYILSTKATPRKDGAVASAEQITSSCEESLRRLQTDYVDLFMFHGVTRAEYPLIREHLYPVARRLQEQGKVRFIGVTEPMPGAALEPGSKNAATQDVAAGGSAFTGHEMVVQTANDGIWDVVMLKYGVLDQSAARSALPAAKAAGLGVLNMSAVRGALVTPSALEATLLEWKAKGLLDQGALPETDPLEFVVHESVSSIVAAGYRFVVEEDAISTVLVGTGNVEHLEQGVEAILAGPLPPGDSARLCQLFGQVTLQRE